MAADLETEAGLDGERRPQCRFVRMVGTGFVNCNLDADHAGGHRTFYDPPDAPPPGDWTSNQQGALLQAKMAYRGWQAGHDPGDEA